VYLTHGFTPPPHQSNSPVSLILVLAIEPIHRIQQQRRSRYDNRANCRESHLEKYGVAISEALNVCTSHKVMSREHNMRLNFERVCEFQVVYNREKLWKSMSRPRTLLQSLLGVPVAIKLHYSSCVPSFKLQIQVGNLT